MLLAIDAGNSDIVFGLYDGREWVHQWRIPSKETPNQEAWSFRLVSELLELDMKPADVKRSVISSVVPTLTQPLQEMVVHLTATSPLLAGPEVYPFLQIKVNNPQEIGTDLVANAVAAYHQFRSCCIIVDFGTALTFTTVSSRGEIIGVAIAPGLNLAIKTLFRETAQLPEVPLEIPASVLGGNTIHAIQAGVVWGYTGLVKYLIGKIKEEVGPDCRVIATGGLSSVFTSVHEYFDVLDGMLTLKGLALIEEQWHGEHRKIS